MGDDSGEVRRTRQRILCEEWIILHCWWISSWRFRIRESQDWEIGGWATGSDAPQLAHRCFALRVIAKAQQVSEGAGVPGGALGRVAADTQHATEAAAVNETPVRQWHVDQIQLLGYCLFLAT